MAASENRRQIGVRSLQKEADKRSDNFGGNDLLLKVAFGQLLSSS